MRMPPLPYTSYDTIRDLRHDLSEADSFYPKINLVWMAMTDWITRVEDCDAFLEILHEEVGTELTRENLHTHRMGYRGTYGIPGTAWKGETLIGLELLFDLYPSARILEDIFLVFEEEMREKIAEQQP